MDDGTEEELGRGEVTLLPPGHDAWVVVIDLSGMQFILYSDLNHSFLLISYLRLFLRDRVPNPNKSHKLIYDMSSLIV
jgi:hypothetical protein